jgi:hypothetical protein
MGSNANTVADADANFFRVVLFALVGMTVVTGTLAAVTTFQAMSLSPLICVVGCS